MAISVVQTATNYDPPSGTCTFTNPTTAGNCVVVFIFTYALSSQTITTTGVTLGGAAGNFAQAAATQTTPVSGDTDYLGCWINPNCAGGQTVVVANVTNATWQGEYDGTGLIMYELSGVATSPLDVTSVNAATSGTGITSGTTSGTAVAGEMALGAAEPAGNLTGYDSSFTNTTMGVSPVTCVAGYMTVSSALSTVTYTATQNVNSVSAGIVITLKPAGTTSNITSTGILAFQGFGISGALNTGQAGSIAVDPTTPAVITATGTTSASITSGTFSPPTATLLAVLTSFEYQSSHTSAPVFTVSDSVGGVYTTGPAVFDGTRGATAIWYRYLSSAPGPMTVTVTNSGVAVTHGQILEVLVLTGANPAQQAAGHGTAYSGTGSTSWTGNISTTVPGSWVLLAGAGSTGSSITPNFATLTLENEQDSTDGVSLLTGRQIVPTGSTTTSGGGGTTPTAPSITTTSLPGATVGTAYSTTLAATGGTPPYTWSMDGGSLPVGITLTPGGLLSGTPTGVAGTSNFTVLVTDSASKTAAQALSIVVSAGSSTAPVGPTGTWNLVFNDEFPGTSLNTANWTALQGANINNLSTQASAISVSGGMLHVGYGGAVNSNPGSGYAGPSTGPGLAVGNCCEAMINFPGPSGDTAYNWPAWWADGDSWPTNGEEDIFESYNGTPSAFNYHNTAGASNGPFPSGSWCNSFHSYTLVRGETTMQVWWDGVLQRTVTRNDNGGVQGLIINVGSGNTGNTSAVVLVEYVRMWTPG